VIHSIAFSLSATRTPMLNLGEISKKTQGTFRLATSRADFGPHLEALGNEIRRQLMLTYFLTSPVEAGTQISVICRSHRCGGAGATLASNVRRAPRPGCAGQACAPAHACVAERCVSAAMTGGRSGAAAVVAVLAFVLAGGGAGLVLARRRKTRSREPGGEAAAQPAAPIVAPQVVLPDFSHTPYVGNSAAAQQMQQQLAHLPYVGQAMAQQAQAAQAAQQRQAGGAHAVSAAAASMSVMVLSGPLGGRTFPLRHGFTIGKLRGCDIVLDDGFTSGHHAQFHLDLGGGCTIVDLGSTNGIFVNGVRTTQQRLSHGMSIRVGQTDLRFLQG
jgi:hypothetical protein